MIRVFKNVNLILFCILLVACSRKMNKKELVLYVQDLTHGLEHKEVINNGTIICSYRPTPLLIAQELDRDLKMKDKIDSLNMFYINRKYFLLSFSQNGAEIENQFIADPTAYANALAYLNTSIAEDISLVTATHDTIPALASIYPRQYGNTGRSTVMLIFDTHTHPLTQDFTFVYRDRMFNLGTVQFSFRAADIAAVPELAL